MSDAISLPALTQLADLDEPRYQDYVTKRLNPEYDHLWEHYLLSVDLIERTRTVLVNVKRMGEIGSKKDRDLLDDQSIRVARGEMGQEEFQREVTRIGEKRSRRRKFLGLVEFRLGQVRGALKKARAAAHAEHQAQNDTRHREAAVRLALAIYDHRASVLAAGATPTGGDIALWERLTAETLPVGGLDMTLDEAIQTGTWTRRDEETTDA